MALNPNHTFEDLGEYKCSIVEKNCTSQRVSFLKELLEYNGFKVIVVDSPPPKPAKTAPAAKPVTEGEGETPVIIPAPIIEAPPLPATFTIGVTDLTFNPTNAIFNRELKTPEGVIVMPHYWYQTEQVARDDEWYWKKGG